MIKVINALPYFDKDLQEELSKFLLKRFREAVIARQQQVDDHYVRWINNYNARPAETVRTTPWHRASNFIPQLIRMHTDILHARMTGVIFGTKPFWKPVSPFGMLDHKMMEVLGSWLEFESFHRRNSLQPPLISSILRAFKTGTCVQKLIWRDAVSTEFQVVQGEAGEGGLQLKKLNQEGFLLENIPFEDFYVYPLMVSSLDKVRLKFHRLRFNEEDVKWRKDTKTWAEGAADFMIKTGGSYKPEMAAEAKAQEAGISLSQDTVLPFTAVEVWFEYPLQGVPTKLIATFNPNIGDKPEQALLKLTFNPDPLGEESFNVLRFSEREDFFYGYSIPDILEQAQEEQAQIHNARRDSNTIANIPTFKKKRLADVPNPASDWYPGKVFELDDMADLEAFQFGANYNSMIDEESFLLGLTNGYTGLSQAQQSMGGGVLDGKRGVYNAQGTMAMLQEGNDRPNLYLRSLRYDFHKVGRALFRYNRNFRSSIDFSLWGQNAAQLQQLFNSPDPADYNPVLFAIGASDGSANREVDRTNLLLMSNTMAGYYNQLFQAVSTVAAMPPGEPIREILLRILDGAKDLADRLLYVFDIGDRNRLIPDVREILGGGPEQAPGGGQPTFEEPGAESPEAIPLDGLAALSRSIASLPRGGPS